MLGLFGTLNLATRALQVQQTGVEIAGQNLANINNTAYARQRVELQTSLAVMTPIGPQGTGVQLTAIQQIRDALLDDHICDETSVGGYWEAQRGGLESAQTALGEFLDQNASSIDSAATAGSAAAAQGLATQISQLFNMFQSVATSPTSLSQRQTLINQAQTLAEAFNQVSTRLEAVNDNLDRRIGVDVESANQLLVDIADLNKEIMDAEAPGGGASNDLRDSRQQKLEALAQLADFELGTAADGSLTLQIGGRIVVSGRNVLETLETGDDGTGKMQVRFSSDHAAAFLTGGSIRGTMAARDGALAKLRSGLDTLAAEMISAVNAVYRTGFDLNGSTGADLFTGLDAATIGVSAALLADPGLLQVSGLAGTIGDNQVALALARMGTTRQAGLGDKTFNETYGLLVTNLGNALSSANDQVANHALVGELLLSRRDSVSGVSMEEEMTSLISFQKAYQASARVVSTIDEMLDELLNMTR
ncbi:MAG TPA: flagellar hook-associated protein FlgK [Clostridia bacterium]|nr:flagellar hook-associated protein FlgK [Clostridia bacterium]